MIKHLVDVTELNAAESNTDETKHEGLSTGVGGWGGGWGGEGVRYGVMSVKKKSQHQFGQMKRNSTAN